MEDEERGMEHLRYGGSKRVLFFLPKMTRTVFDLPSGFFLSHIEVQRQAVSFASINFLLLNFVLTTQPLTSDFYN